MRLPLEDLLTGKRISDPQRAPYEFRELLQVAELSICGWGIEPATWSQTVQDTTVTSIVFNNIEIKAGKGRLLAVAGKDAGSVIFYRVSETPETSYTLRSMKFMLLCLRSFLPFALRSWYFALLDECSLCYGDQEFE